MPGIVTLETLVVKLIGDDVALHNTLNRFEGTFASSIGRLSQHALRLGTVLSAAITAPLIGIGAASVKEFTKFETTLSRIEGLVGLSAAEVEKLGNAAKLLGPEAGKSANELAEALYFVASAGFTANEAIEVVKIASRAAAAGLGETKAVANAITGAMAAYGKANLSATEATDILTAAVKVGKAEAAEFSPVLGMLLPLSSELGVSFGETAGMLGYLTRVTGNASQAATQVRGAFTQMVRTTKQAREALAAVGLTTDYFRQAIKERGALAAMSDLRKRLEEAHIPLTKVWEDIEGLIGVLQLTGPGMSDAAAAINETANSAGVTDAAFAAAAKTTEFRLNQSISNLKNSMIDLGEVLIPVVEDLSAGVSSLTKFFSGLNDENKRLVVYAGAAVAALGPMLMTIGLLNHGIGALIVVVKALRAIDLISWLVSINARLNALLPAWTAQAAVTTQASTALIRLSTVATTTAMTYVGAVNSMAVSNLRLGQSFQTLSPAIARISGPTLQAASAADVIDVAFTRVGTTATSTAGFFSRASTAIGGAMTNVGSKISSLATSGLGALKSSLTSVGAAANQFKGVLAGLAIAGIVMLAQKIYDLQIKWTGLNEAVEKSQNLASQISARHANERQQDLQESGMISDPGAKKDFLTSRLEEARKELAGYQSSVKGAQKNVAELDTTWANIDPYILNTAKAELKEMETEAAAAEAHVHQLESELRNMGVGLSEEAKAAIETADAMFLSKEQLREAAQITEQSLTPMEKFTQLHEKLDTLLGAGAITQETYNRALLEGENEMAEAVRKEADNFDDLNDAKMKGMQITEQYMTAQEKFNKKQQELNDLYKLGAIDQKTYQRAVTGTYDELFGDKKGDTKQPKRAEQSFTADVSQSQRDFLALQAGGSNSPEERTAKATEKVATLTEEEVRRKRREDLHSRTRTGNRFDGVVDVASFT